MNEKYEFRVGDLCYVFNDDVDDQTIYRVYEIKPNQVRDDTYANIEPVFSLLCDVKDLLGNFNRHVHIDKLVKLSIVDLGTHYVRLGQFIVSESKKFEQEDSAVCADVSARNDL